MDDPACVVAGSHRGGDPRPSDPSWAELHAGDDPERRAARYIHHGRGPFRQSNFQADCRQKAR